MVARVLLRSCEGVLIVAMLFLVVSGSQDTYSVARVFCVALQALHRLLQHSNVVTTVLWVVARVL